MNSPSSLTLSQIPTQTPKILTRFEREQIHLITFDVGRVNVYIQLKCSHPTNISWGPIQCWAQHWAWWFRAEWNVAPSLGQGHIIRESVTCIQWQLCGRAIIGGSMGAWRKMPLMLPARSSKTSYGNVEQEFFRWAEMKNIPDSRNHIGKSIQAGQSRTFMHIWGTAERLGVRGRLLEGLCDFLKSWNFIPQIMNDSESVRISFTFGCFLFLFYYRTWIRKSKTRARETSLGVLSYTVDIT